VRQGFAGPHRPIKLVAGEAVLNHVAAIAPGWPRVSPGETDDATVGNGILSIAAYAAPSLSFPHDLAAANGAVGALIGAYVVQDRSLLALHAAALLGRDGLIVLLGDHGAGKSTMAVALAARGLQLVTDDRLVVRDERDGIALGLMPKLRVPLPPNADAAFRAYVVVHAGAAEGEMHYVDVPDRLPFGATAPLAALIELKRSGGEPVLQPGTPAKALVGVTFAPHLAVPEKLARIARLAALPSYTLTYGDTFAAADFLERRFA